MSINTRMAARVADMLERYGFNVTLESSSSTGDDFDDGAPTWSTTATLRALWGSALLGQENRGDARPESKGRTTLIVSYTAHLKDNSTLSNKRIAFNGTNYNPAAVSMIGDKVALMLTLEDGVAT